MHIIIVAFTFDCMACFFKLRCNREFKLRNKLVTENPERLRGFVLFLAELFQQLEIQASAALSLNCISSFGLSKNFIVEVKGLNNVLF